MKNHNCFNGNGIGRKQFPQIGRSFDGILERKKFRKIGKSSVHNVRKAFFIINNDFRSSCGTTSSLWIRFEKMKICLFCMKLYFDKLFVHILSWIFFVSTAVFGSIWAGELYKRSRYFSQLIWGLFRTRFLMSADFSDKEKLREKGKWRF